MKEEEEEQNRDGGFLGKWIELKKTMMSYSNSSQVVAVAVEVGVAGFPSDGWKSTWNFCMF